MAQDDGAAHEQLMQRIARSRGTPTYSQPARLRLRCPVLRDPVDPTTGGAVGMNAQCVQFSPRHNAVIVSMGTVELRRSWRNTRAAIVFSDHPLQLYATVNPCQPVHTGDCRCCHYLTRAGCFAASL